MHFHYHCAFEFAWRVVGGYDVGHLVAGDTSIYGEGVGEHVAICWLSGLGT